ncbi:MAG TPA: AsmA family protein [Bryobacteraceae bacterium]|nr:AsmA family protein [Bryobacteraceae bacterium]
MRTFRRSLLIALFIVVAFGVAAPFLRADRLRPRIQAALEAALNRPVTLGAVHLNLFTGPGFTVDDVQIDDDPAAGIEPFAHVDSMQARIRWTSLFAGKLAFSSLRLDTPSVNVVRMPSGPWNIQPLLDHRPQSGTPHRRAIPDIQIRGGRIDFKFGDTKSVFYISGADVDVYANESGDVVIRFSGAPARTDQASQTFGELTARGLLQTGANGEDQLSMGLHLDRTAISELTRLFHGSDIGVHGFVLANAKLAGPLSKIAITGDLNISDVHRWDLMPSPGEGWTLNCRGLLDLNSHHLELATLNTPATTPVQPDPVSVEFRLDDYLAAPKWSGSLQFRGLPAASLVETARHFGAPFPPGVQVEGKVEGSIGYSSQSGVGGQLTLASAAVKFPQGGSAQFDSAQVQIADGKVVLAPSDVEMEDGQFAQVEGEYAFDNTHAAFRIATRQLTVGAAHLFEAAPIPLIEQLRQGAWKGWISFEKTAENPAVWSGQYELQNAVVEIPGIASPVRLASASVQMNGDGIQLTRMHGRAGTVKFDGEYRYQATALHPHRLRLTIPELQIADAERLMLPALRRTQGFLARTFRLRDQPLPKWLAERDADITVQVPGLMNGESLLGELRAHAVWRGASINLSNVDWRMEDTHASGKMAVNLAKAEPAYQLNGAMENFDYRSGQLDVDGEFTTSGIGADLLLNLRSKGTFEGRGIVLAPDAEMRVVSGAYRVAAMNGIPRLLLSNVQVSQGSDTLVGQGSSQPDGHLVLELTSGRRQVRLTGMLLPVHPEPLPSR